MAGSGGGLDPPLSVWYKGRGHWCLRPRKTHQECVRGVKRGSGAWSGSETGGKISLHPWRARSVSESSRQGRSLVHTHHEFTLWSPQFIILWKANTPKANGETWCALSLIQSGRVSALAQFPRQMKIVMKTIYTQQSWMIAHDDLLPAKMGLIKKKMRAH